MQKEVEKARKKKKKKTKCTILILFILTGLITCGIIFGIPYLKYKEAKNDYDKGSYDVAYDEFMELGDYLDSRIMAEECIYQKGKSVDDSKSNISAYLYINTIQSAIDLDDIYGGELIYFNFDIQPRGNHTINDDVRLVVIWPDGDVTETIMHVNGISYYVMYTHENMDEDDYGKLICRLYDHNSGKLLAESFCQIRKRESVDK